MDDIVKLESDIFVNSFEVHKNTSDINIDAIDVTKLQIVNCYMVPRSKNGNLELPFPFTPISIIIYPGSFTKYVKKNA